MKLKLFLAAFASVTAENSGHRKFTQLVSNHFFSYEDFMENLAVVNHEGMSNKLRNDRAGSCPCLNRFLCIRLVKLINLGVQFRVNKGTLFQ